ncbi:MAG: hypothetical protein ACD_29C00378G0002, partial [uncultured bacterium]
MSTSRSPGDARKELLDAMLVKDKTERDKAVNAFLQRHQEGEVRLTFSKKHSPENTQLLLLHAVKNGYPKIVKLLLDSGANPNNVNEIG